MNGCCGAERERYKISIPNLAAKTVRPTRGEQPTTALRRSASRGRPSRHDLIERFPSSRSRRAAVLSKAIGDDCVWEHRCFFIDHKLVEVERAVRSRQAVD